jgi:hypothetical protein
MERKFGKKQVEMSSMILEVLYITIGGRKKRTFNYGRSNETE